MPIASVSLMKPTNFESSSFPDRAVADFARQQGRHELNRVVGL